MSTTASTDEEAHLLSVPEAARIIGVSPSTIWRWIDRGILKAYRIGPRRVRVREADIARLLTTERAQPLAATTGTSWLPASDIAHAYRPITPEERKAAMAGIAEAKRFARELAEKYNGGRPFTPESWELLAESRDERTEQLG